MAPTRKALRLSGYDYSRCGTVFVTVVLAPRGPILGTVVEDGVIHSPLGRIVDEELKRIEERHAGVRLVTGRVMPDHVHAVIGASIPGTSMSLIVGAFKSLAARRVNIARRTRGAPFWQRGFHDHIVRDQRDLERCVAYIQANPARWLAHPQSRRLVGAGLARPGGWGCRNPWRVRHHRDAS